MTQAERDRLVALKKAKKKLITQKLAAEELGITERHVRRLLRETETAWRQGGGARTAGAALQPQDQCGH
jgi:predicted transcriptional regulator